MRGERRRERAHARWPDGAVAQPEALQTGVGDEAVGEPLHADVSERVAREAELLEPLAAPRDERSECRAHGGCQPVVAQIEAADLQKRRARAAESTREGGGSLVGSGPWGGASEGVVAARGGWPRRGGADLHAGARVQRGDQRTDASIAGADARQAEHAERDRRPQPEGARHRRDAAASEGVELQAERDEDVGLRPEAARLHLRRRLRLRDREHAGDVLLDFVLATGRREAAGREVDDAMDGEAARRAHRRGQFGEQLAFVERDVDGGSGGVRAGGHVWRPAPGRERANGGSCHHPYEGSGGPLQYSFWKVWTTE